MEDALRCPGCAAELRLPSTSNAESVQCPRCRRVFVTNERATTAITKVAPLPGEKPTPNDDHELFDEGKILVPMRRLRGRSLAFAARLLIAASVGALLLPTVYVVYDSVMSRWSRPPIHFGHQFGSPNCELNVLIDHTQFAFQFTMSFAFVAFAYWLRLANQNARKMANGTKFNTWATVTVQILSILWVIILFAFLSEGRNEITGCAALVIMKAQYAGIFLIATCLQEIWRSSDPMETSTLSSWKHVAKNRWITVWLWTCFLAAPIMFIYGCVFEAWIHLSLIVFAAAGIVLITIIRDITNRQQQRYARLFEDAV
jgi:Zn-finger nucleic acid-binding protein